MSRNYGTHGGRPALGGMSNRPSARANTPREYVNRYFPSGSILAEPVSSPLERSRFSQALFDILAVIAGALLVTVMAVSVVIAFAILFFVKT